jgi:hypothetical protein
VFFGCVFLVLRGCVFHTWCTDFPFNWEISWRNIWFFLISWIMKALWTCLQEKKKNTPTKRGTWYSCFSLFSHILAPSDQSLASVVIQKRKATEIQPTPPFPPPPQPFFCIWRSFHFRFFGFFFFLSFVRFSFFVLWSLELVSARVREEHGRSPEWVAAFVARKHYCAASVH